MTAQRTAGGKALLGKLKIPGPEGVIKCVPDRVFSITVHPATERVFAFVGDKWGRLGIWETDEADEDAATTVFKPHARPIPAIVHCPGEPNRIMTCSYDGSVRTMDVTAEAFPETFASDDHLFHYLDVAPDGSMAYLATREGTVMSFDSREATTRRKPDEFEVHDRKVGSVQVNPAAPHLLVTCSLDRTVRLWDVRKTKKTGATPVQSYTQGMGISSAFFSSDGQRFVTTGHDNTVRVYGSLDSGWSDKQQVVIKHNNHTGRWLSNFRAIWHPHDSSTVLIGNMARAMDVLDADTGAQVAQLSDADTLTAVPTLNAIHPSLNRIVSSTASGRLYVWR